MNNIWNLLIPIFTTIAGSGLTYFFARRKNTAEAQGKELQNVEEALKIYRGIVEDLARKIEMQSKIIAHQQTEIQQLRTEIAALKIKKPC
jgi:peptidoglycan hydrolase CwlO-like protein